MKTLLLSTFALLALSPTAGALAPSRPASTVIASAPLHVGGDDSDEDDEDRKEDAEEDCFPRA